ncbi:MAG TPA: Gfo/Idh/MocA family oxidoreductase, partial [Planctomycetota bacterium]|nr:Gfo/Idh/MocA family oxidoreductase [Planctomycetota bacterium]
MDEKKIRVAIVGLGFGAEFIPIYQGHPNADLYAICQRNEQKLNQIGDAFKINVRYTDYAKLL